MLENQKKNIKPPLKLFKLLIRLKSMFVAFCLIFYMLIMCNQMSSIRNMRCTCEKNNTICTVKCGCINCDNGKLLVQSVKRRKEEPPILTISLSSQTPLTYQRNSGENRERSWIISFQHFILDSLLCITMVPV